MKLPDDRKYTESYLWFKKEGDVFRTGIVEPAIDRADKFLFLELPEKGDLIEEKESLAEYEAMKRVGELSLPVKAEIIEKNEEVENNPEKISEDPYKEWLVKLKIKDENENKFLSADKAEEYYEEQM